MSDRKDVDVVSSMRDFVDEELRSTYTATVAIIEEINEDAREVEVSLKKDESVFVGPVKVATTFAEDGGGLITPLAKEDEGLLIHTKETLYNRTEERGPVPDTVERQHTLQDAVFFPRIWLGEDTIPDHDAGEWKLMIQDVDREKQVAWVSVHPDGQIQAQVLDAGSPMVTFTMEASGPSFDVVLEDAGLAIALSPNGVTLGDPEKSKPVLNEDAKMNDTFLGLGGGVKETGTEDTEAS
jgi:hypothetical protein